MITQPDRPTMRRGDMVLVRWDDGYTYPMLALEYSAFGEGLAHVRGEDDATQYPIKNTDIVFVLPADEFEPGNAASRAITTVCKAYGAELPADIKGFVKQMIELRNQRQWLPSEVNADLLAHAPIICDTFAGLSQGKYIGTSFWPTVQKRLPEKTYGNLWSRYCKHGAVLEPEMEPIDSILAVLRQQSQEEGASVQKWYGDRPIN